MPLSFHFLYITSSSIFHYQFIIRIYTSQSYVLRIFLLGNLIPRSFGGQSAREFRELLAYLLIWSAKRDRGPPHSIQLSIEFSGGTQLHPSGNIITQHENKHEKVKPQNFKHQNVLFVPQNFMAIVYNFVCYSPTHLKPQCRWIAFGLWKLFINQFFEEPVIHEHLKNYIRR